MNTTLKSFLLVIFCTSCLLSSFTPCFAETTNDEGGPELNSESAIYYTVKKGDTLWDLSQRFNNSAWKWPGMWGDNQQLTNPHRIYPGQKIKLFFRSDIDQIKKLEKAIEEPVVMVEPEETDKTVEAVDAVVIDDTADSGDEKPSEIKLPFYHYSKIGGVGFMRAKPAESHGYIFKLKGPERLMISKGDEVFIKEDNDKELVPGAKYFTYRVKSASDIKKKIESDARLHNLTDKAKKIKVGHQHYITGVVQITGKQSGYAVGTIVQSYRTIYLNDMVIPYTYRSPDITLSASVEDLSGALICSEEDEGVLGDDKIAFIDKGSNDGVKTGQIYNIFYPEEKASAELIGGKKLFVPVDFASFLVLHVEETTATVLITSAYQVVTAGDTWHYPQE
jgi:hypothetical protein